MTTQRIFFIADTHFGSDQVRRYENRPFKDVLEMDAAMVERWNSTVSPDDIVWHLGDFGAEGHEEKVLSQLNGTIFLVKGNHNSESNSYYRQAGFHEVYDHPILIKDFWLLSHEPLYVSKNVPYANIFGHVHQNPMYHTYSSHHFCVSAERINYTPVSFSDIVRAVQEAEVIEAERTETEPQMIIPKKKYFYCFVRFQKYGKQYAYLSHDRSVEPGDYVLVKTDCETVVRVLRVKEHTEEDAPYPPSKCKYILRLFAKGNDLSEANLPYPCVPVDELTDSPDSLRENLFDFLEEGKYCITPKPVCTEFQVRAIEKAGATRLPTEYRRFLLEIGNGIYYPSRQCIEPDQGSDLKEISGIPTKPSKAVQLFSMPFRFDDAYHSYESQNPYADHAHSYDDCFYNHKETEDIDNACTACKHKRECPEFFSDELDIYEYPFFNGTLLLHYAGCTYTYHLILNGKHRGEVWLANETNDFSPVAKSFTEYLRKMLDHVLL